MWQTFHRSRWTPRINRAHRPRAQRYDIIRDRVTAELYEDLAEPRKINKSAAINYHLDYAYPDNIWIRERIRTNVRARTAAYARFSKLPQV